MNYHINKSDNQCTETIKINCEEYEDDDRADSCKSCPVGYYLSEKTGKKVCELKSIENCKEYVEGDGSPECKQCLPNFFVKNGKCSLGNVENCEYFSDELLC